MSKKEHIEDWEEEELQTAPPDGIGQDLDLESGDKRAMEAMRKFTDEDDDDKGDFSVRSILGGDFLMSKFMIKQVAFVMFCVLLMILYTGNRYSSQQDDILTDSLRGHLQDVKYNVLTQSSELMNLMRQSNVEHRLHEAGDSLLHNPTTPPYLIKSEHKQEAQPDTLKEEIVTEEQVKKNEI